MRIILACVAVLLLLGIMVLLCARRAKEALICEPRDILRKKRTAKTAQEFEELACYYENRSEVFRAFAVQHQHERDYFLTHRRGEQYRFASECTRLLRKYDESRARESDALVERYRERANSVSTLSGETVTTRGDCRA